MVVAMVMMVVKAILVMLSKTAFENEYNEMSTTLVQRIKKNSE